MSDRDAATAALERQMDALRDALADSIEAMKHYEAVLRHLNPDAKDKPVPQCIEAAEKVLEDSR